jgi:hypothetical protein
VVAGGTAWERFVAIVSVVACLLFVLGLSDSRMRAAVRTMTAPPPPAQLTDRDGSLRVRVVERGGRAIGSAGVRVFWENEQRYYLAGSVMTGGDGTALATRLPRGVAWVIAEAPGFARRSTKVIVERESRTVELELEPERSLEITTKAEDGAALPRATVLVTTSDALPFGALTDAHGVARVARLPAAPWSVKASAPGYESVTRSGVNGPVTLVLRRLGAIEVAVQDPQGKPVAGAVVHIAGAMIWPPRRADTNAAGTALISGLLAGNYDLKATKGDLVSETLFAVELARGSHERVTLKLTPGRMVTVLVTDGDGESPIVVPNADVVVVEDGLSSFPIRGRTGTAGTVVLGPISSGAATVSARAAEFVARGAVPIPEPLTGAVRVSLLRGGTIEGRVVDGRDFPVDGASIEVVGFDMYGLPVAETPQLMNFTTQHFQRGLAGSLPLIPAGELGVMPGPIPTIPNAALPSPTLSAPLFDPESSGIEPWVTRADGTFIARPVTPGRVRALVRHPAYVETMSETLTVSPGGRVEVKIVMRSGGSLEGRVMDDRGRTISGARVLLSATRGSYERSTTTGSDGSFAFAAVPDEVTLSVARPERPFSPALRRAIRVEEGRRTTVDLQLPAPREPVEVRVTDERGSAVEGAQVTMLSLDPNAPIRQTLFTTTAGTVVFEDARGLKLRVVVDVPGFPRASETVEGDRPSLRIALARGVLVEGKVTADRGREPVAGATVTLIADGVRKVALTDAGGAYRLTDVRAGAARLTVSHPTYAEAESDVDIHDPGRADRAFELPTVDLEQPGSIEGEVVDARGDAVLAARVAVGMAPAFLPAGALPAGIAVTDSSGRFTLKGVRPGNVSLEAFAPGVGRGRGEASVVAGRTASRVRIRLSPTAEEPEIATTGSLAVTLGERGAGQELDIVVVHVAPGSEAERAGVRAGDILVEVDGRVPSSMQDARARLSGPAGSDVIATVVRGDSEVTLRIVREQVRR